MNTRRDRISKEHSAEACILGWERTSPSKPEIQNKSLNTKIQYIHGFRRLMALMISE
jgi:hypothetical protein